MEIVKNNKGGSKLCFEGYTYSKKSASKTTIHWESSQREAYVCKGKVTTYSQVARVIRTVEYSHDANLERVESVISKCNGIGFQPDPITVVTDFERAVINAVSTVFVPHVRSQGCFYHLTQSTWRKVQKLFCGMLDGLAFLPVGDVPDSRRL